MRDTLQSFAQEQLAGMADNLEQAVLESTVEALAQELREPPKRLADEAGLWWPEVRGAPLRFIVSK